MHPLLPFLTALCSAAVLTACSAGGGAAYPAGWTQSRTGTQSWTNPKNPAQSYTLERKPSTLGTLKDLASQLTIDVILRNRGAKFVRSDPYPACPGAAGLETFTLPNNQGLQVAFALWNGQQIEASYRGPRSAPIESSVTDAMARSVCTPN